MSKRGVQTLILLVDNEFGVLTRVTAMVRREGWNIKSLVVAETMNPAVSRLTISVECIDSTLPGVLDRLRRLNCVRSIVPWAAETHFGRELILVTVGGPSAGGAAMAAEAAGARLLDERTGGVTIEFAGAPDEADALLTVLRPFGIVDIARSGIITLECAGKEGDR